MDWEKKYHDLKKNFDLLDRHNDVLYRVFHTARALRNSGYDGEFIGDVTADLFRAIRDVEQYEKGLKND